MPPPGSKKPTLAELDAFNTWLDAAVFKVDCTGGKRDPGMIRLEFPGARNANDDKLEPISWEEWFNAFDENKLALLYQETTRDGEESQQIPIVKSRWLKEIG